MTKYTDDWTPERTAEMTRLRRAGNNAAEIARRLGGTNRRAVAKKLNAMGLAGNGRIPTLSETSIDRGIKTKTLSIDVSPPEVLRPRRFSWEQGA